MCIRLVVFQTNSGGLDVRVIVDKDGNPLTTDSVKIAKDKSVWKNGAESRSVT
jgi:hypothetical protein